MKGKILVIGSILAALLLLSSYNILSESGGEDKGKTLLNLVMKGMEYYHYQPQDIDDSFSEKLFDTYLERMDYNKRFFTQRDVENLSKYRQLLDDELNARTFELFDLSRGILEKRIQEADGYVSSILASPFQFDVKEELDTDFDNMSFASSETEVQERWRKALKYQVLTRVVNKLERQEKAKTEGNQEIEIKSFALLEEEARAHVAKNYAEYFKRERRLDEADRRAEYLNSVATIFDPHTNYLPPRDKENFDIQMSGRLEGIGARLSEEDGFVKVVDIVPGSASARQGELELNDLILKVAQEKEEPVSIVDMDLDDAVKLIRGPKGTKLTLNVRKIDGSEVDIELERDVVVLEEVYAKSALLKEDSDNESIGYIHLPKFYIDFNDPNGRRCATDVATEIKKLQAEGMDGLILDLRDNGGGSLQEVVDMAGLFIEKGPIVQVKGHKGAPRMLVDRDDNILYDGPLVVMVNSFSASASEILAAAIQDYDRGVIVGSPSTFGKGTVQRFVNLDNLIRGDSTFKPLGELKMTTQKFYRINGGATQLKGVVPDVILPDAYSLIKTGEKEQDYSMPWDEIKSTSYQTWPQPVSAVLPSLNANSQSRVAVNPTFQLIQENAERLKKRQSQYTYPLQLTAYRAERKKTNEEAEKYKNIRKEIEGLEINTPKMDLAHINSDTIRQKRVETWHKNLRKDIYVFEAMEIVKEID